MGINGRYSPQAERLICLAGASWSFDVSCERLQEFCRLAVSDTTIREICQRHGQSMLQWQRESPQAVQEFREQRGDIEFTTDGTSVNTTRGWREMKLGIFSKRHRGETADVNNWETRKLPKPHVRIAFAAVERSHRFGARWKAWAKRLAILDPSIVTVLADGAHWIWEEALKNLPGADGMLDVFHALEHISDTAKVLFSTEPSEATQWTDTMRMTLLSGGWNALEPSIEQAKSQFPTGAARSALESLETYLGKHSDHLNYDERLASGCSIGSGQVEGACKNLVARRLKQTGARWRIRRLNRMAGLCGAIYSDHWNSYWETLAP